MKNLTERMAWALKDIGHFSALSGKIRLRRYQLAAAHAILHAVLRRKGQLFIVMFPRQSGKNELQAQIAAYTLLRLSYSGASMVSISPTLRPQAINAMQRLEVVLRANLLTRSLWKKELANRFAIGKAGITFLSGAPEANIVGATASPLLFVDEAQSIDPAKYDKEILPMAASTNAVRVLWGTAWTSQTLLARELRAARAAEQQDGVRRVFITDANAVCTEVPPYRMFLADMLARHGRNNPFVRSQFFSEEIDAQAGLFPEWRQAFAAGSHPARLTPRVGAIYAVLIDVAGEDAPEATAQPNPTRDATAFTVVEVDLSTLQDALLERPTYRVVYRRQWVGTRHTVLYPMLRDLARLWHARWVVVDATGIGAGLASFLAQALPRRVIPFTFTQASKSQLGWDFTSLVDSGRWKDFDPASAPPDQVDLQRAFTEQMTACSYTILPGPAKTLRWGVPQHARHAVSGQLIHDDLLISAALCARLDDQDWHINGKAVFIPRPDPLKEMENAF